MSQEDRSHARWKQLFSRLERVPPMEYEFQRELAEASAQVFLDVHRKNQPSKGLAPVFVCLALVVSLVAFAVFVVPRPIDSQQQAGDQAIAVVQPDIGGASCWNLRSAFEQSEQAFAAALDKQLANRRSRKQNIRWSSSSFLETE